MGEMFFLRYLSQLDVFTYQNGLFSQTSGLCINKENWCLQSVYSPANRDYYRFYMYISIIELRNCSSKVLLFLSRAYSNFFSSFIQKKHPIFTNQTLKKFCLKTYYRNCISFKQSAAFHKGADWRCFPLWNKHLVLKSSFILLTEDLLCLSFVS